MEMGMWYPQLLLNLQNLEMEVGGGTAGPDWSCAAQVRAAAHCWRSGVETGEARKHQQMLCIICQTSPPTEPEPEPEPVNLLQGVASVLGLGMAKGWALEP